jgi:uncharacterized oxidoreductase
VIVVDGGVGYGQVVAKEAMDFGIERAKKHGVCVVGLTNAHHIGRIGHWAEQCARAGMVSTHWVNVHGHKSLVAPFGGAEPRFTTNPYCTAVPRKGKEPIVLDFATSQVAMGKVPGRQQQEGADGAGPADRSRPAADHRSRRDVQPAVRRHPAVRPAQGRRAGGDLRPAGRRADRRQAPIRRAPSRGRHRHHQQHAVDHHRSAAMGGTEAFEDEVETFITWVKSAKPQPGVAEVLAPGEPERARKIDREKNGVPIDSTTWQQLIDVARKVRLNDTEIPRSPPRETTMAKMKLYYSPSSPYARKVGWSRSRPSSTRRSRWSNVALTPVAPNADVDKHNPIGKIPALSVKGIDLFDSPVICEYLDSQHKGRKLFPRKGRDRWVALRQQAMADGLLDAALLARYEGALRPEEKRWPEWSQGQMKKMNGVLTQLEAETKSLKGKLTIGTLSVACALGYLDLRFADMGWRDKYPKLANGSPRLEASLAQGDAPPPA